MQLLKQMAFLLVFHYIIFGPGVFSASAASEPFKSDSPINFRVEKILFNLLKCKDRSIQPPNATEMSLLLYFMTTCKRRGEEVNPENYSGAAGIFFTQSIGKSFPLVLRYLFNPDIPAQLLFPSSLRLTRQLPESSALERPVWELLPELTETPVFYWSIEEEEITPDDFSGTYYKYKLSRLIMLFRHNGRPMLMVVSWQDGESEIGKRGGVLGGYNDWDYVYSDKPGATASGIGWAETRIYASASVTLLYPEEGGQSTGYAVFKWLKAGTFGLNMVQARHIAAGAERAFAGFMEVINRKNSPSPQMLEKMVSRVQASSDETLLAESRSYCLALAELSKNDSILSEEDFQLMLKDGQYCRKISREHLEALVMNNEVKHMLGKPVLGD
jgi:hypothetical protein